MPMDSIAAPRAAAMMAAELHKATGHRPSVAYLGAARWQLQLSNDRVELTIDYQGGSGKRAKWAGSTLKVDGERRELARDFDDFVRIFADPDGRDVTGLDPVPDDGNITGAPPIVQDQYRQLAGQIGELATVEAGQAGRRWIIGVTFAGREAGLRMFFTRARHGGLWTPDPRRYLQVVVDGQDISGQVGKDLDQALARLMPRPGEPAPSAGPVTAPADRARQNSVEVRKATVIRN